MLRFGVRVWISVRVPLRFRDRLRFMVRLGVGLDYVLWFGLG